MIDFRLRRRAIDSTQPTSPRGLPRCADSRTAAHSFSERGSFTRSFQREGGASKTKAVAGASEPIAKAIPSGRFRAFAKPGPQSVSLNVSANNAKVLMGLYRKALVPLLVYMPHPTGVLVGMISHRMSAAYPSHEAAHPSVMQRTQENVVVIGHPLVRKPFQIVDLLRFMKDSL